MQLGLYAYETNILVLQFSSGLKRVQCENIYIFHSNDLESEDESSKFLVHVGCTVHVYTVSISNSNETSDFILFGQIELTSTLCCLQAGSFQVLRLTQ